MASAGPASCCQPLNRGPPPSSVSHPAGKLHMCMPHNGAVTRPDATSSAIRRILHTAYGVLDAAVGPMTSLVHTLPAPNETLDTSLGQQATHAGSAPPESWQAVLHVAGPAAMSRHCLHQLSSLPSCQVKQAPAGCSPLHVHSDDGQPTACLAMQGVRDIIAQARKAKCPDADLLYISLVKAGAAAMNPTDARSDAACVPCHQ